MVDTITNKESPVIKLGFFLVPSFGLFADRHKILLYASTRGSYYSPLDN